MKDIELKERLKNKHMKTSLKLLEESIALMNLANENYAKELQNIYNKIIQENKN